MKSLSSIGMAFTLATAVTGALWGSAAQGRNWYEEKQKNPADTHLMERIAVFGCMSDRIDTKRSDAAQSQEFKDYVASFKDRSVIPQHIENTCISPVMRSYSDDLAFKVKLWKFSETGFSLLFLASLIGAGICAGLVMKGDKQNPPAPR